MKQTSSYVLFLTLTHFNMTHCLNSIMTWLLPMSTLFLVIKMDVNGMFCCSLYLFIKLVLVSVQAMSNMTQIWGSFTCLLSLSLSLPEREEPPQQETLRFFTRSRGWNRDPSCLVYSIWKKTGALLRHHSVHVSMCWLYTVIFHHLNLAYKYAKEMCTCDLLSWKIQQSDQVYTCTM